MPDVSLEDFLLDTLVALAAHHGEELQRSGSHVETSDGTLSLSFNNLEFRENRPGTFVVLATVQISAPSTGLATLYDSLLEGGPDPDTPLQQALMETYHLLQFVQQALRGAIQPDTNLALANTEGTRGFNVYSYGPIVRANDDAVREILEKTLEEAWVFRNVFAEAPSALTRDKPYWVKVNHLKAGEANIPECRIDEGQWLEVQSRIAAFQWPANDELMGYKQFFIFLPSGQTKNS